MTDRAIICPIVTPPISPILTITLEHNQRLSNDLHLDPRTPTAATPLCLLTLFHIRCFAFFVHLIMLLHKIKFRMAQNKNAAIPANKTRTPLTLPNKNKNAAAPINQNKNAAATANKKNTRTPPNRPPRTKINQTNKTAPPFTKLDETENNEPERHEKLHKQATRHTKTTGRRTRARCAKFSRPNF